MATLLVLGGTSWLGGEIARQARDGGIAVTCLARGESGDVPEGVDFVPADRAHPEAYDSVRAREWDAVIDVSWQPGFVASAVSALHDRTKHWTYVSSLSAYRDDSTPGQDESASIHEPLESDTATTEQYGPAKVRCEQIVVDALADRALVARVGLIAGPGDRSDRYGYWVSRFALAADGAVLVPDAPDVSVQVIDVRDFAAWIVDAPARGVTGTMNVAGERYASAEVIALSAQTADVAGSTIAASPTWLIEQGVEPWMGPRSLPLWLPMPEYAGFGTRIAERAVESGLVRRPLAETTRDTLADERARGLDRDRRAGLTRAEELALIDALRGEADARILRAGGDYDDFDGLPGHAAFDDPPH